MTYDDLTTNLSEKNSSALLLGPMFIGADSDDMTFFIEEVWRQPVTDDNLWKVISTFKKWYKKTNPDEYHPMRKPLSLYDANEIVPPWEMPALLGE